jgi:hypothetical protein
MPRYSIHTSYSRHKANPTQFPFMRPSFVLTQHKMRA